MRLFSRVSICVFVLFCHAAITPAQGQGIADWSAEDLGRWEFEFSAVQRRMVEFDFRYTDEVEAVDGWESAFYPLGSHGHIQGLARWAAQDGWAFSHDYATIAGTVPAGPAIYVLCTAGECYVHTMHWVDPDRKDWHHPSGIQVIGNILGISAGGVINFIDIRDPQFPVRLPCSLDVGASGHVGITYLRGLNRYLVSNSGNLHLSDSDDIVTSSCSFERFGGESVTSSEGMGHLFSTAEGFNQFYAMSARREGSLTTETRETIRLQAYRIDRSRTTGQLIAVELNDDDDDEDEESGAIHWEYFTGEDDNWPSDGNPRWGATGFFMKYPGTDGGELVVLTSPRNFFPYNFENFEFRAYSSQRKGELKRSHLQPGSPFLGADRPLDPTPAVRRLSYFWGLPITDSLNGSGDEDIFPIIVDKPGVEFIQAYAMSNIPIDVQLETNSGVSSVADPGNYYLTRSAPTTAWMKVDYGETVEIKVAQGFGGRYGGTYKLNFNTIGACPQNSSIPKVDPACPDDDHGDDINSATPLVIGAPSVGQYEEAGDYDAFQVEIPGGLGAPFLEVRISNADQSFAYTQSSTTPPDFSNTVDFDGHTIMTMPVTADARYYFTTTGAAGTEFSIQAILLIACPSNSTISNKDSACPLTSDDHSNYIYSHTATPLLPWISMPGVINTPDDRDIFSIHRPATSQMWMTLTATSDRVADISAELYRERQEIGGTTIDILPAMQAEGTASELVISNQLYLDARADWKFFTGIAASAGQLAEYSLTTRFIDSCPTNATIPRDYPDCEADDFGDATVTAQSGLLLNPQNGVIDSDYDQDFFILSTIGEPAENWLYFEFRNTDMDALGRLAILNSAMEHLDYIQTLREGVTILALQVPEQEVWLRLAGEAGTTFSYMARSVAPCPYDNAIPIDWNCPDDHGDQPNRDSATILPLDLQATGIWDEPGDYDFFRTPFTDDDSGRLLSILVNSQVDATVRVYDGEGNYIESIGDLLVPTGSGTEFFVPTPVSAGDYYFGLVSAGGGTSYSLELYLFDVCPFDPSIPSSLPDCTDSDEDGIGDSLDNCPNSANADQLDFDGDALGDACDTDDDNDGLSDEDETDVYGTNPLNPDSDGDNAFDGDEVIGGSDPLNRDAVPQPLIARYDIGDGRDTVPHTQYGWVPLTALGCPEQTPVATNHYGPVTVTVTEADSCGHHDNPPPNPQRYPDMLRDSVFIDGDKDAEVVIELTGLPVGEYQATTYHHDWGYWSQSHPFYLIVDDGLGNDRRVVDRADYGPEDNYDGESFLVYSNGIDPVFIRMGVNLAEEDSIASLTLNGIILKYFVDLDEDGVADDEDNCPFVANPGQVDSDGDGLGNACDEVVFDDSFE